MKALYTRISPVLVCQTVPVREKVYLKFNDQTRFTNGYTNHFLQLLSLLLSIVVIMVTISLKEYESVEYVILILHTSIAFTHLKKHLRSKCDMGASTSCHTTVISIQSGTVIPKTHVNVQRESNKLGETSNTIATCFELIEFSTPSNNN